MRVKLTLCAALALVSAMATTSFAQQLQWDRTGDHLVSYGPVMGAPAAVAPAPAQTRPSANGATQVIDRTADHMLYYGPVQ